MEQPPTEPLTASLVTQAASLHHSDGRVSSTTKHNMVMIYYLVNPPPSIRRHPRVGIHQCGPSPASEIPFASTIHIAERDSDTTRGGAAKQKPHRAPVTQRHVDIPHTRIPDLLPTPAPVAIPVLVPGHCVKNTFSRGGS